jgi:hypothetical protein
LAKDQVLLEGLALDELAWKLESAAAAEGNEVNLVTIL